tara:strand:+ start:968 stop:1408 length:441 start_codon:yes stop_codon:yes gene_type:complete
MKTKFKETKSKKCCGKCPFKKGLPATSETLGHSHPFVYIGQTRGPFWLPCHADKNYSGKGSNVETVTQCRGAAIFRANCETPYKLPEQLLSLEKDEESVFANEAEFIAHYTNINKEKASALTSVPGFLDSLMEEEFKKKSETKRYL